MSGPPPGNVPCELTLGLPPAATARGAPRVTETNMSLTITLADMTSSLANGGSAQVGRICVLLPGPPEHIQLQEGGKDEGGRYQQPLSRPGETLGTAGTAGTAEEQMAQLKRRIKVTEEGMTKVMDRLQEMLTTICSLKTTVEGFEGELQLLKDSFHKAGREEMQEQSVQQDEYSHILQSILDQLKADKAALKTKASQEELQHAMVQLSEMMQDLLQKMSQMDQDTQNALEKLLNEMDSKVDHVALAPLQAQLEQVKGLIQQCLCQRSCNAGRAAGFKRQLSGPVKCISCNRPLAMAPAPPLVTIRKTGQLLHPQPASASNCLAQQLPERARQGPGSSARPLSTSTSLITVCPCGNPEDFICNNREADILGIDGVIYKSRLNSLGTNRTTTMGEDFPCRGSAMGHRVSSGQAVQSRECPTVSAWDGAVPLHGKCINSLSSPCTPSVSASHLKAKNPQTHTRHTTEKTVCTPKYGSHYVSPYSRAAMQMKTSSSGGRWQTAMGSSRTSGV